MATLNAIFQAIAAFFGYQSKKQEIAQRADLVKAKTAQTQQDLDDTANRLTRIAQFDPDPNKRRAALEELRLLISE